MLQVSENEVDKSEISDADSIWTDEDEDLPNSDSTDGKNMRLCITVQSDKQTYDTATSVGLFAVLSLEGEIGEILGGNPLQVIFIGALPPPPQLETALTTSTYKHHYRFTNVKL